jgi:hypothetical protein
MMLIEALYLKTNGYNKLKDSDDESRFDEIFKPPGAMRGEMG